MTFMELWKKKILAYKSENIVLTPWALWNGEKNRNWKYHGHIQLCYRVQGRHLMKFLQKALLFQFTFSKNKILLTGRRYCWALTHFFSLNSLVEKFWRPISTFVFGSGIRIPVASSVCCILIPLLVSVWSHSAEESLVLFSSGPTSSS